jgi:F-type H+-transporting ATPase subunit delta
MSNEAVAKRYALALFEIAKEQQMLQSFDNELRIIKKVVLDNPDLISLLKSPKLSADQKKLIIKDVFNGSSVYVINLLMLLMDRNREAYIAEVADAFIDLSNEEQGIAEASVYSVRPLTANESAIISSEFAKKVNKVSLNIENIIDPDLLGGLKVQIGNRIFDGSLQGKLSRLKRELIG